MLYFQTETQLALFPRLLVMFGINSMIYSKGRRLLPSLRWKSRKPSEELVSFRTLLIDDSGLLLAKATMILLALNWNPGSSIQD